MGSTYFSANSENNIIKSLCLDADYQQGPIGATADGYGHYLTDEENFDVYKAAYRTVKLAVRYARLYENAYDLFYDLPLLFAHVGKAVRYGFTYPESAPTVGCVLTRVFPLDKKTNKFTVVAAGVGDAMVAYWNPHTKIFKTLIEARHYDRGGMMFSPIAVSEKYSGGMLQRVSLTVPQNEGVFLLRMTDGAWGVLPHKKQLIKDHEANRNFLQILLDDEVLTKIFSKFSNENPMANEGNYMNFIKEMVMYSILQEKKQLEKSSEEIKKKLSLFLQSSNEVGSVGDFLQWVEKEAAKGDTTFKDNYFEPYLKSIGYQDSIGSNDINLSINALQNFLSHTHIGDDITLRVEHLSNSTIVEPYAICKMNREISEQKTNKLKMGFSK